MVNVDLGHTFTSDIVQANGNIVTSSIDHIYLSKELVPNVKCRKMDCSSSDHLPILATLEKITKRKCQPRRITKRFLKNFTQEKWKRSLISKELENLADTENLDDMTTYLNRHVTETLDECARMKTFKVRELHKFGISESTKQLINDRDLARKSIKTKTGVEKAVQHTKYKKLRNRVNSELKKDNIMHNSKRVREANDEKEIWKVIKDVANPKSDSTIRLVEDGEIIEDEKEVADIFNTFFVSKISDPKDNIDSTKVEDPLTRLKKKMDSKNLKFSLKTVSEKKFWKQSKP
jgi:hypothetical protein